MTSFIASPLRTLTSSQAEKILSQAGIIVGGGNDWDIQVHNSKLFSRIAASLEPSLALGESYMDGWWDVPHLDELFTKLLRSNAVSQVDSSSTAKGLKFLARLSNPQRKSRAFNIGERHYDIGNDLYQAMLDQRLTYTCGYWREAQTLDQAQEAKLDLVCRKAGLKPGMRVLDIGCGWGSFAKFAAEKYGVSVVGVTVSKEQVALGTKLTEGLPVEIRLQDYRDVGESFDAVVSLGMFEHVGYKNHRTYMQKAAEVLTDDGTFLLHTIGGNTTTTGGDPWLSKYIFPDGELPSIVQIGQSIEGLFTMEDWHNFGADYDKTLMAWFANFDEHWPELKQAYDDRFYRMWKYYLLSNAGLFRARHIQLWQIVLKKKGKLGGYASVR